MLIPVHCRSTMGTGVVAVRHIFTSLRVIMMIKTVVHDDGDDDADAADGDDDDDDDYDR